MPTIKVLKKGRWAVPGKPWLPQIEAKEGTVLEVGKDIDHETAIFALEHGKAEEFGYPVDDQESVVDEEPEAIETPPDPEVETKPAAKTETKPQGRRGRKAAK